jgi:short-subunit dehydrogenase
MRKRRAGHVLNVTSVGGLMTFPGVGVYNASKFALEGINEALASQVRRLSIKVTAIEPGAFRTDWAGRSKTRANRTIDDYEELLATRVIGYSHPLHVLLRRTGMSSNHVVVARVGQRSGRN